MSDPVPMVVLENVRKSYGKHTVLNGVSLAINKGEVVTLIGPSGSGKTTLLRCMNLLTTPDSGVVRVDGETVFSGSPGSRPPAAAAEKDRKRVQMGMVFQRFNLFPHMTALENVMLAPVKVLKLSKTQARELAVEQLRKVGLHTKVDSYPAKLSGGQQQRVAIARALAMSPQIMLFDEPTSALDPELVGEVLEIMRQLAEEGMTMAIVTHEMDFARFVADRVVVLHEGQILEQGPPGVIFSQPRNERTRIFLRRTLHSMGPAQGTATAGDPLLHSEGTS